MTNRILGGLLVIWGLFAISAGGVLAEPPNYRFVPMLHDGKLFGFDGRTADINDVDEAVFRAAFPADSGAGVPLGDSFNIVIWIEDQLYLVDHPAGSAGGGVDRAVGINDAGRTTGAYNPPNASLHLHTYTSSRFGPFTELGLLPQQHPPDSTFGPCNFSWGHDINDFDQVVGIAYEGSNFFTREAHGVIWNSGTPTKIPHPSGLTDAETGYFLPFFINNSGQVASTNSYLGTTTAFFGTVSGTDTLPKNISGVQMTEAMGLGSTGLVVGQLKGNLIDPSDNQTYYQEHAFVSDNGGPLFDLNESINATWRVQSAAYDANGRGDIVGAQGFQAALWRHTDSGRVFYSLKDLVTEGDVPTTISSALAINERGVILVNYTSGLGATPGLLVPIYPAPPVLLEVDSLPPKRTSYLFEVIDGIDSTVRFEKEVAYDTVNNLLDTLGYNEVIDSLKVIDMLRIMTVDSIDSVPPGEEIPVKESRLDNGTFPAPGYGLTYPTRDELPDTVRLNRRSFGMRIDMSVGFEAAVGLQSYIAEMVESANRILVEATDGTFYICEANIYNNREKYDSVYYRLDQVNDRNRNLLGFYREGQAHTINPLMRYYADNGAGTFSENLADQANWSPVSIESDNLEYNTGVPLALSILSQLFGGVLPEISPQTGGLWTNDCDTLTARAAEFTIYSVYGAPFIDELYEASRTELTTPEAYGLSNYSLASVLDCLSGTERLEQSASSVANNLGYNNYQHILDVSGPPSVSPYRSNRTIFQSPRINFQTTWQALSTRQVLLPPDSGDKGVGAHVFVTRDSGGIQRMGRTNLSASLSYNSSNFGSSWTMTTYLGLLPDSDGESFMYSSDSVSTSDTSVVRSILRDVKPALVLVRATGLGYSSRRVEVKEEFDETPSTTVSGSFEAADRSISSAIFTSVANKTFETLLSGEAASDTRHLKINRSASPDGDLIASVSQQTRVIETTFGTEDRYVEVTTSSDGELTGSLAFLSLRFTPSKIKPSDTIPDQPSLIITTNYWPIGRTGIPASMEQISSSHYVATATADTTEAAIILTYSDADLSQLGDSYHPENLQIYSRTMTDSVWTMHPTVVDTLARTAATVALPDRFFALFADGVSTDVSYDDPTNLPESFTLSQNYPNPFNPSTTIEFSLPTKADVTLDIYNIMGQRVRRLVTEPRSAGAHTVVWDGRADGGNQVASGVYLYRLTANDVTVSKKMMLLK